MDSDQGKLFIGGISWEASEDRLKEYFDQYGDILQTVVMRDKVTCRPRGSGFVVFSDPSVIDTVLQEKHTIDGRTVIDKVQEEKKSRADGKPPGVGHGRGRDREDGPGGRQPKGAGRGLDDGARTTSGGRGRGGSGGKKHRRQRMYTVS